MYKQCYSHTMPVILLPLIKGSSSLGCTLRWPYTKIWHNELMVSTKGSPFSYRTQSRERQHVASKVHTQTAA